MVPILEQTPLSQAGTGSTRLSFLTTAHLVSPTLAPEKSARPLNVVTRDQHKKPRSTQLGKCGDSVDWWSRAKLGFNGFGQSNWRRQPPNLRDAARGEAGIPERRPQEGEH